MTNDKRRAAAAKGATTALSAVALSFPTDAAIRNAAYGKALDKSEAPALPSGALAAPFPHPSWKDAPQGKKQCEVCGALGVESRVFVPDAAA